MHDRGARERRLGFAVKVLRRAGMPSHDTRRWQSNPHLSVSLAAFRRILQYLSEEKIRMYRISSDFVPYATHPDLPQFHRQLEESTEELQQVGQMAAELDVRLSLYPSQYIGLNAPDDDLVRRSMWDLDVQARLLDAMDQASAAVVVLHVGGVYGDRRLARERFLTTTRACPSRRDAGW